MKSASLVSALLLAAIGSPAPAAPTSYPPLSEYMMPMQQEAALARSAAPPNISGGATIEVLTAQGYKVETAGTNGFDCLVMRGFTAPTYTPAMFRDLVYDPSVRAPICFNALAAKEVMPYYKLRTDLAMKGKSPDEIQAGIEAAYNNGQLPKRSAVSFGYMWSKMQILAPAIQHWHPHLMIFAPYLNNAALGGNEFGSPLPQASDDADTPFSVIVIPVGDTLFVSGDAQETSASTSKHQ